MARLWVIEASVDGVRFHPVMPSVLRSLVRAVQVLGLAASLSAIVIAAYLSDGGFDGLDVVIAIAAFAPPIVLWVLWAALRELAELPERLRRLPETARERQEDLRRLSEELRTPGRRLIRVPLTLWRLRDAADLVRPYAPLLPFLSVPFLTWSALAAVAALVEITVALVLLVAAAL
jgi:hypothetical protein